VSEQIKINGFNGVAVGQIYKVQELPSRDGAGSMFSIKAAKLDLLAKKEVVPEGLQPGDIIGVAYNTYYKKETKRTLYFADEIKKLSKVVSQGDVLAALK